MLSRYWTTNRRSAIGTRTPINLCFYSEQKNQAIIDFLKRCQKEEEVSPTVNSYKVTAYKHAIRSILGVQQPIRLGTDVLQLPGVGTGIQQKINEFLFASEAEEARHPQLQRELSKVRAIKMLQTVPGIGPTTAKKLVEAGCNSIEDLRLPSFLPILSEKQRTKIKYMGHIEKAVEREDAEDVLSFCRRNLDSKMELTLVGDYRRGSTSSPEIRLMASHPDYIHVPLPTDAPPFTSYPPTKLRSRKRQSADSKRNGLLHTDVLPIYQKHGLIAETLSSSPATWEGVIRLPEQRGQWGERADRLAGIENSEGRFRRMIINFVSHKSRGASLLVLTGDADFNKHISSQASRCGMLFNEHGLWKWNLNDVLSPPPCTSEEDNGESLEKGYWSLVKSSSEEEIFEELGLDFIEPDKRNFSFVSGKRSRKVK